MNPHSHCNECVTPADCKKFGCVWCSQSVPYADEDHRPTLPVRRLHPRATLPTYATDGAAGLDLYALDDWTLPPHGRGVIKTGVAVAIPNGYEGQIRPRSGRAKEGLVAVLGTVDSDYTGEVGVLLENRNAHAVTIANGDRVAQLVVAPVARVRVEGVSELPRTARGDKGWGSTGS